MPTIKTTVRRTTTWDLIIEAGSVEDALDAVQTAINDRPTSFGKEISDLDIVDDRYDTDGSEQLGAGWSADYFVTELGSLITYAGLQQLVEEGGAALQEALEGDS